MILIVDLEVKFSVRGQLPPWLCWESDSALVGRPLVPNDGEGYKVQIPLNATYNAFGITHVIESQLELDVRPPGSGVGDLASSLRTVSNLRSALVGTGMEGGMESYLDDEDDDMAYMGGQ